MSAKDLEKRLLNLELRFMPHGQFVVLTVSAHATPEEEARGLAEAQEAAGPNGQVIHVSYEAAVRPDWWGPEQDAMMAVVPSGPPYEIKVNDAWRWWER